MRNILGEKLEKFLQKQIVDIPEFSGIEVETVGDLEKLVKKLLKVCNSNVEGTYAEEKLLYILNLHLGNTYRFDLSDLVKGIKEAFPQIEAEKVTTINFNGQGLELISEKGTVFKNTSRENAEIFVREIKKESEDGTH